MVMTGPSLVSCPVDTLLDPPANFRAGQGAPTRHSGHYGEEAQRRPARKGAAQRVRYLWDRTLGYPGAFQGAKALAERCRMGVSSGKWRNSTVVMLLLSIQS